MMRQSDPCSKRRFRSVLKKRFFATNKQLGAVRRHRQALETEIVADAFFGWPPFNDELFRQLEPPQQSPAHVELEKLGLHDRLASRVRFRRDQKRTPRRLSDAFRIERVFGKRFPFAVVQTRQPDGLHLERLTVVHHRQLIETRVASGHRRERSSVRLRRRKRYRKYHQTVRRLACRIGCRKQH